jgi:hypothetical protein
VHVDGEPAFSKHPVVSNVIGGSHTGKNKFSLFAWLISHQSAILFSHNKSATSNQHNKSATSNQPAVLFSQNKPAPATSQTNRLIVSYLFIP